MLLLWAWLRSTQFNALYHTFAYVESYNAMVLIRLNWCALCRRMFLLNREWWFLIAASAWKQPWQILRAFWYILTLVFLELWTKAYRSLHLFTGRAEGGQWTGTRDWRGHCCYHGCGSRGEDWGLDVVLIYVEPLIWA